MDWFIVVFIAAASFVCGLIPYAISSTSSLAHMDDIEWSRHLELERVKTAERAKYSVQLAEIRAKQMELEAKQRADVAAAAYSFAKKLGKALSASDSD